MIILEHMKDGLDMGQAGVGSGYIVQVKSNRTLSNKMNGGDPAEHQLKWQQIRNGREGGVKGDRCHRLLRVASFDFKIGTEAGK